MKPVFAVALATAVACALGAAHAEPSKLTVAKGGAVDVSTLQGVVGDGALAPIERALPKRIGSSPLITAPGVGPEVDAAPGRWRADFFRQARKIKSGTALQF